MDVCSQEPARSPLRAASTTRRPTRMPKAHAHVFQLCSSAHAKSGGGDQGGDCFMLGVSFVCESRINALPYPFGSTTESKIRWCRLLPISVCLCVSIKY